uniref:Uncharacterized protein n=1 Tax=Megaselia scalaris TaxID=36166 RepID=T1H4R5_MEGSC
MLVQTVFSTNQIGDRRTRRANQRKDDKRNAQNRSIWRIFVNQAEFAVATKVKSDDIDLISRLSGNVADYFLRFEQAEKSVGLQDNGNQTKYLLSTSKQTAIEPVISTCIPITSW